MGMVICLAGKIASGKTSVSQHLAAKLEWPRVSFGDYVRSEVTKCGEDATDRHVLQVYGQKLVETDARQFCERVLDFAQYRVGSNLLVDGVRHLTIFQHLRSLAFPDQTRLIFLQAPDRDRVLRAGNRGEGAVGLIAAEAHAVESELHEAIPAAADLLVDASLPIDQVVSTCFNSIQGWRGERVPAHC